jgi:uncharacterized protein YjbI with pentapeptide repeats
MPKAFLSVHNRLAGFIKNKTGYFFFLLFSGLFILDLLLWFFTGYSFAIKIIVRNYATLVHGAVKGTANYEEQYRMAFKEVIIGLGAIITLIFQFLREWNFNRQVKASELQTNNQTKQIVNQTRELEIRDQTRNDEQFKQAVEMLGDAEASLLKKQGAVFILVSLAIRSPDHTQRCVDMLCTLNEWMAERIEQHPDYFRLHDDQGVDEMRQPFKPWVERIFRRNEEFYKLYMEFSRGTRSVVGQLSESEIKEVNRMMDEECLSQLVVKEMRKIAEEIARRNDTYATAHPSIRAEDKFYYIMPPKGKVDILNLRNRYLCQLDVSGLELHAAINFSDSIIYAMKARRTNARKADFSNARMRGADLGSGFFLEANFMKVDLSYARLHQANMAFCELEGSLLQGTEFEQALLQGAGMRFCQLQGASLIATSLQGANLSYSRFEGALFFGADMTASKFEEVHFKGGYFCFCNFTGLKKSEKSSFAAAVFYDSKKTKYNEDWAKTISMYLDDRLFKWINDIDYDAQKDIDTVLLSDLPTDLNGWYGTILLASAEFANAVSAILRNLKNDENYMKRYMDLPIEISAYKIRLCAQLLTRTVPLTN